MLANALRIELSRYASEMRRSNSMLLKAKDGTLSRAQIHAYLGNLRHLGSHTAALLGRARDRSRDGGDELLAEHFEQVLRETEGQELWMTGDTVRTSTDLIEPRPDVAPSMRRFVTYLEDVVDAVPVIYLAYMLFAEYLTTVLGAEWPREGDGNVDSRVAPARQGSDLDRERVEDILDAIDARVGDPRKLPEMREALLQMARYFEAFCAEVTEDVLHDTRSSREIAPHVSAA